jgi:hypothetical protein
MYKAAPTLQVALMIYSTLAFAAYVAHIKPFEIWSLNPLEVFNEFIVLICLYHMIVFTEGLIQDQEMIYMVGWSMDLVLLIHFVINMCILAYQFFQTTCNLIRRFIRKQQMKARLAAKEYQEITGG